MKVRRSFTIGLLLCGFSVVCSVLSRGLAKKAVLDSRTPGDLADGLVVPGVFACLTYVFATVGLLAMIISVRGGFNKDWRKRKRTWFFGEFSG